MDSHSSHAPESWYNRFSVFWSHLTGSRGSSKSPVVTPRGKTQHQQQRPQSVALPCMVYPTDDVSSHVMSEGKGHTTLPRDARVLVVNYEGTDCPKDCTGDVLVPKPDEKSDGDDCEMRPCFLHTQVANRWVSYVVIM